MSNEKNEEMKTKTYAQSLLAATEAMRAAADLCREAQKRRNRADAKTQSRTKDAERDYMSAFNDLTCADSAFSDYL